MTPYTVAIPDGTIADLRNRLAATRWPDHINDAGWSYGTDPAYLRDVVEYWGHAYDWRASERRLNAFANFKVEIDGFGIHFIHGRGAGSRTIPLLLLHGWPGSIVQFQAIIPLLTAADDTGLSFDVIAPSLPGYGFSGRAAESGMNTARIGQLLHRLMTETLGHERYAIRASDLGAGVMSQIALAHPEAIIGLHTGGTNPWLMDVPDDLTADEQRFVADARAWNLREMGYAMEQSSKPQTLAYALNDSPAGLAGWILEKFHRWSDHGGNLESRFRRDDLLANLTIYWATETIGSSMRLYYETIASPGAWGTADVPTAMLMSPHDLFPTPRAWVERTARVDRWTEIEEGGHFLEWEVPHLVEADLRAFFHDLS
jgi:pimeloyl-ACP methyl ester carboxylesterase